MNHKGLLELSQRVPDEHRGAYLYYLTEKSAPELMIMSDKDIPEETEKKAKAALDRVLSGEPLQYIFGYTWFYGMRLLCKPGVLIPRPDTEIIVEEAIKLIPRGGIFADICIGSGCIAAAVLENRPDLECVALDISQQALALAGENLAKFTAEGRCTVKRFDLFERWEIPVFDAILSNPPYIKSADIEKLEPQVRREPRLALDGGCDGLDFYRRLIATAPSHLRTGCPLLLEVGYDTARGVEELAKGRYDCKTVKDLSGTDRVAVITV